MKLKGPASPSGVRKERKVRTSKIVNLCETGYPHDGRADKDSHSHDGLSILIL